MRARVITLEMRNGAKVFVRFYPEGGEDAKHLEQQLRAAGYISVYEFRRKYHGGPVVGHAPARWKAYFDQGVTSAVSKASNGQWKGQEVRVVHV